MSDGNRLQALAAEAETCQACDLWRQATQTVFGEGPADARIVLVGEQPGDEEDLAGSPFVGPAGRLLDKALAEAGLDRADVYVTNAVKHFKWSPRGKRRIHEKPNRTEAGGPDASTRSRRTAHRSVPGTARSWWAGPGPTAG
jgi:DNA polymerase